MRRALAIAMMFLRPHLREPLFVVLISIIPASYILVFFLVGGQDLSRHALYGTVVVFSTNLGIISLSQLAVLLDIHKLQEMFVASPIGPGAYALGLGLSRLAFASIPLSIVVALLLVTGSLPVAALPQLVVVIAFTIFVAIMMGFAISVLVPHPHEISRVANTLGLLLSVAPPVYYPLELVSPSWQWLPMLVPTANAAQLLRLAGGLAESTPTRVAIHWGVLAGYALLSGFIVFRRMTWQET